MSHFEEPKGLNHVSEFHNMFNLPVLAEPTIPSQDRCNLRINLLQEELDELKEALANHDLVEAADALADLQYVLSGAILELGLANSFSNIFNEVHRSNMSKTCKTLEQAKETQAHYLAEKGTKSEIVEKNGEFLVYRVEDKKVLKSIYYSEANIASQIQ
jgi:predicted HAD superfamily Cof-like phosphohydrolase